MVNVEVIENKGTKKRYILKVKEEPGFFDMLFGGKEKTYRVLVLGKQEIPFDDLDNIGESLINNKAKWKKNDKANKKGKACDYTATLPEYKKVTFFIDDLNCNNATEHTSKTTKDKPTD